MYTTLASRPSKTRTKPRTSDILSQTSQKDCSKEDNSSKSSIPCEQDKKKKILEDDERKDNNTSAAAAKPS